MGTTGKKLIDVLTRAWSSPFKTRSDFARENAELVAMAASDGFITTKQATGLYGNEWRITPSGLRLIELIGDFKV